MSDKNESSPSLSESVEFINSFSSDKITINEMIEVIGKIQRMHRNKSFSYFSEEDIESQVALICIQQIKYYEPSKAAGSNTINSIERWLNRVVKNRLSNYYRDNYSSVNENHKKTRANLNNCIDISSIESILKQNSSSSNEDQPISDIVFNEFKDFVESKLSKDVLDIYYACLDDENVSSYYKTKLSKELDVVFNEWNKMHEGL